ncbi:hypothetical protein Tco_0220265, partial [Tanacetum coccineum]
MSPFGSKISSLTSGEVKSEVWILQKSQENGQNQTNTDTGTDRVYKSRENAFK